MMIRVSSFTNGDDLKKGRTNSFGPWARLILPRSPCKLQLLESGAEGIRSPYPSAVQRRHDTSLERSIICETPANKHILPGV